VLNRVVQRLFGNVEPVEITRERRVLILKISKLRYLHAIDRKLQGVVFELRNASIDSLELNIEIGFMRVAHEKYLYEEDLSRKGAKRCRVSKAFLCVFAPLREKHSLLPGFCQIRKVGKKFFVVLLRVWHRLRFDRHGSPQSWIVE